MSERHGKEEDIETNREGRREIESHTEEERGFKRDRERERETIFNNSEISSPNNRTPPYSSSTPVNSFIQFNYKLQEEALGYKCCLSGLVLGHSFYERPFIWVRVTRTHTFHSGVYCCIMGCIILHFPTTSV